MKRCRLIYNVIEKLEVITGRCCRVTSIRIKEIELKLRSVSLCWSRAGLFHAWLWNNNSSASTQHISVHFCAFLLMNGSLPSESCHERLLLILYFYYFSFISFWIPPVLKYVRWLQGTPSVRFKLPKGKKAALILHFQYRFGLVLSINLLGSAVFPFF